MNTKIRLAIIDSGISEKIEENNNMINGYSLYFDKATDQYTIIGNECIDEIGHGTAIVNIINQNIQGIFIDVYKLYQDKFEIDEDLFIKILLYISENNNYDVLHISSGVLQPNDYSLMYSICNDIAGYGTIIVSAFDNDGAVSYPAAFPFVIGVDLSDNRLGFSEYEFVKNSIVNIRASASFHRLMWTKPSTMLAQGSSFSSVYITLKVIDFITKGITGFKDILSELEKQAVYVYKDVNQISYSNQFVTNINKAIVFPFNKEVHSLIRYCKEVPFDIVGIYDSKYTLRTGKKIKEIEKSICSNELIQDIDKVDWESDFDTLILGHTDQLSKLSNIDYKKELVRKCKLYNKRLFSFDKIDNDNYSNNIYYPKATLEMVPKNRFGKMRCISKPVLGIWGTSSQQGKFTLQMKLKTELNKIGYKVGLLSTEPQSALFLADRVFPIGYNSTVEITDIQAVTLLNEYMWEISCSDCDIILVGSQSGTVPFSFYNLSSYPVYQYDILFGTQPDYVVLCVNAHDDYNYIRRTIHFIQSSIDTKIIGLVVYPLIQKQTGIGGKFKKQLLSKEEMNFIIISLEKEFHIKAYPLQTDVLTKDIIDIFSRGD